MHNRKCSAGDATIDRAVRKPAHKEFSLSLYHDGEGKGKKKMQDTTTTNTAAKTRGKRRSKDEFANAVFHGEPDVAFTFAALGRALSRQFETEHWEIEITPGKIEHIER